jgi:hypothetical protein
VLEWSSRVVIKPHPRTMIAQEAHMTARYAPMRVTKTPEMTDVIEAPRENGIILESALSRGYAAKASGIDLT